MGIVAELEYSKTSKEISDENVFFKGNNILPSIPQTRNKLPRKGNASSSCGNTYPRGRVAGKQGQIMKFSD